MPTVLTNGISTYYEQFGDGPPIVFLHGGTMDHRIWAEQAKPLADSYRVIVYDLRGHGHTGGSDRDRYTIDLFTDDLHAFTTALDLDRPVLCGLSLGGMIAFTHTVRYPGSAAAVVMIGALTPEILSWREWVRRRGIYRLIDWASPIIGHDRVMTTLDSVFQWLDQDVDTGHLEQASEVATRHSATYPGMEERELDKLTGEWTGYLSMKVDYSALPPPLLYLYGEREYDFMAAHARHIEGHVPNGEAREVPRAGHFSHVDNPEFLTETLREFLADIDGLERIARR